MKFWLLSMPLVAAIFLTMTLLECVSIFALFVHEVAETTALKMGDFAIRFMKPKNVKLGE